MARNRFYLLIICLCVLSPPLCLAGRPAIYDVWQLKRDSISVSRNCVLIGVHGEQDESQDMTDLTVYPTVKRMGKIALTNPISPPPRFERARANARAQMEAHGPTRPFAVFSHRDRTWFLVEVETGRRGSSSGWHFLISHAGVVFDRFILQQSDASPFAHKAFLSKLLSLIALNRS